MASTLFFVPFIRPVVLVGASLKRMYRNLEKDVIESASRYLQSVYKALRNYHSRSRNIHGIRIFLGIYAICYLCTSLAFESVIVPISLQTQVIYMIEKNAKFVLVFRWVCQSVPKKDLMHAGWLHEFPRHWFQLHQAICKSNFLYSSSLITKKHSWCRESKEHDSFNDHWITLFNEKLFRYSQKHAKILQRF